MKKRGIKGPEYLVIDNFTEYFGLDNLLGVRTEAEAMPKWVIDGVRCDGTTRCDAAFLLNGLEDKSE